MDDNLPQSLVLAAAERKCQTLHCHPMDRKNPRLDPLQYIILISYKNITKSFLDDCDYYIWFA